MTFLIILSVNLVVFVALARQRRFAFHEPSGSSSSCRRLEEAQRSVSTSPPPAPLRDHQAVYMLLACALLYITTQAPAFVFNVLKLVQHAPFCRWTFTEASLATFARAVGLTININYSVNFLLYYGVSSMFRQGLYQLGQSTKNPFQYRKSQMSAFSTNTNRWPATATKDKKAIAATGRPTLEATFSNRTLLSQLAPETPNQT